MVRRSSCRRRRRSCSRRKKRLRGRNSAFFYFLSRYRKSKPGCPARKLVKDAARKWKCMSVAQKCRYKRLLSRSGKRYTPISPFIIFFMRLRKCPSNRKKPVTQLAREAGRRWKRMTPEQKCRYKRASMRMLRGGTYRLKRTCNRRRSSCRKRKRSSSRRRSRSRRRRSSSCRKRRKSQSCSRRRRNRSRRCASLTAISDIEGSLSKLEDKQPMEPQE